ncbi:plasma membrane fusion protein PRM1 [Rhodotorula toruloides]|uniref:Plasma membrane fusion protein PRM1 n=1 Tax=Rhodotorula toruloides TaxID=5286 RepID=A0A511KM48_RHOTO|nr:plasma membrane fusion protein PRM1 [Rhodotorula toruloides]
MTTYLPPSYPVHLPPSYPPRPVLRPYLGPRAHISLSWLSQEFLALLLLLIALAFLLASIPALTRDAKASLTSACAGVEGAASVAVSLPHYMADGVNDFIIDTYRSLYLCLLDLAVHGSITVLVKGIEEAQAFVTNAISGVRTAIQASIGDVETAINKTVGVIDKIPGGNIHLPSLDVPELSALQNVTLPNTLVTALSSLNSSIPTLSEFRSTLDDLVSKPIESLRANISGTLSNSTIDVELLPIPPKQTVELCTNLDTSWIDDVGSDLGKFVKVAIGLVVLMMALFIVANALWEKWRYRVLLDGVEAAREAWLNDLLSAASSIAPDAKSQTAHETLSTTNLLSFLNASSHPTLFRHVSRLASLLRLSSSSSRANLIWFISYIAHPPAWAFLALGLVGLIVVQIQLAILDGPIRRMVRRRAEDGAGQFSSSVMGVLNERMRDASETWANGTNKVVLGLQDDVNNNLFGWVNDTTTSLNSTMNGFYAEITDTITKIFNGTVLEDPALNLIYCLVGSKVNSISTALTWLHNHAHLSLPTVSPSALLLSQNRTNDLTSTLTNPNSTISAPSIAAKMVNAYERNLEQQRTGFIVAIGLWVFVVLMGLLGAGWRARGAAWWAKKRGGSGGSPDEPCEKVDRFGQDEEKSAFFKPLHLRSTSSFGVRGASFGALTSSLDLHAPPAPTTAPPPPPSFAAEKPYFSAADQLAIPPRGNSPSARSWASLIDYFKPTDQHDQPASNPFDDPSVPSTSSPPRTLALPALSALRLPRVTAPSLASERDGSKLKPLISGPRSVSTFRSLRDAQLARRREKLERRRENDLVPLRDERGVSERRFRLPGDLAGRVGGRRRGGERKVTFKVDADDGWEELPDLHESPPNPFADTRAEPSYPRPPSLPRPATPPGRRSSPLASGQPISHIPSPRRTNPFSTPFDDPRDRL